MASLKENVIIGKPIPAGTGLRRYRDVGLTYKGRPVEKVTEMRCPTSRRDALREIEELLPQPQDWSLDSDGYFNSSGSFGGYYSALSGHRGHNLSDEDARLYIYDDLGVSQRWANKFSEAGIETVADLLGHTEEDLLRIEGIGVKAIEELKEGLAARDLMHVIEDDLAASSDDMSQLLDMVFSPDDTILIGGDEPPTFNTDGEEMLGEALPPRSYQRNLEELDALLGNMAAWGSPRLRLHQRRGRGGFQPGHGRRRGVNWFRLSLRSIIDFLGRTREFSIGATFGPPLFCVCCSCGAPNGQKVAASWQLGTCF